MAAVDTLLVRIEADMKDLRRDLNRVTQQTARSTQQMQRSFAAAGRGIKIVGAAIAAGFGLRAIKSITDVGASIENLRVRLDALFGSAEEGGRALQKITQFAARVPFSLGELQAGAGSLAAVTKNAEELEIALAVTANAAALSGLSFVDAASNIQRAFSAGAAAAEGFRNSGVLAMLGFQAGVSHSAEETIRRFIEAFGPGGKLGSATDDLAKTFAGTVSMLGDSIFNFKATISNSGLLDELKKLTQETKQMTDDGRSFAHVMGGVLASAVAGVTNALVFLKNNIQSIIIAFGTFFSVVAIGKILAIGAAFVTLARNMAMATGALKALSLLLARGPLGMLGVGLTAAVVALERLGKLPGLTEGVKDLMDSVLGSPDAPAATPGAEGVDALRVNINPFERGGLDPKEQKELESLIQGTATATERLQEEINKLQAGLNKVGEEGLPGATQAIERLKQEMFETSESGQLIMGAIGDVSSQVSSGIANVITQSGQGLQSFKSMFTNIVNSLIKKMIEAKMEALLMSAAMSMFGGGPSFSSGAGGGGGGFSLSGIFSSIGSFFSFGGSVNSGAPGFRNTGGSASAGRSFIVGERGPELFTPRASGMITPNNMMNIAMSRGQNLRGSGGGPQIVQNLNMSLGVQQTVRAEVMNMMPMIKQASVDAVIDARQRGGSLASSLGA